MMEPTWNAASFSAVPLLEYSELMLTVIMAMEAAMMPR